MNTNEVLNKLIVEIERRLKDYWEISFHNVKAYGEDSNVRELKELRSFIISLQQERLEFPTTDEEVENALASIPKVELPDKYKTPDWLFKQQEQPGVDLDALVDEAFDKYSSVDGYGQLSVSFNRAELYQLIKRMALVFNARKED